MMDGFSTVVLLALLTLGNATPLTTVTQIPRTDEDVFREAVTDGFIVVKQLLTTQAPQNRTTTQQRTTTQGGEEGSAMGESPEEPIITSATQGSAIQSSTGPFTSTPAMPAQITTVMATSEGTTLPESEDRTSTDPSDNKAAEETTTAADLLSTMSDSGSGEKVFNPFEGSGGDEELLISTTTTSTSTSREATGRGKSRMNPVMKAPAHWPLGENMKPNGHVTPASVHEPQANNRVTTKPSGHVTPEWIIIVGFLVGLAALVLIFVAIATREKWNGPDQFNQTGVTLNPDHKLGKAEMEDLLHKKHPKVNGKAEEYTVIPLDELPNSHLS